MEAASLQRIDFLAVGHITADVSPDGSRVPGGAVTYAALAARSLGLRVGVVTRAETSFARADLWPGIALHVVPASVTTTFENRYGAQGGRTQRLLALAPPLAPEDIPSAWRRVAVAHFGPVMHEVGPAVMDVVTARVRGLAPQGWLRHRGDGDLVTHGPWLGPPGLLERADAVVLSAEDLAGVGHDAAWFVARTALLAVTAGAGEIEAFRGDRVWRQPAAPAKAVDVTGAGDTFAAALFILLAESGDPATALRFASAAAAFKVEHRGPGGIPDRAAIWARAGAAPDGGASSSVGSAP